MRRMLISSFYNTLIDKEDAIPMSTMIEIDKLRKNGILFSVCTNRDKEDVLYYNHDYPFIDYIISFNGNYIYDIKGDKCIYSNPLKKSVIKKIEKLFNNFKMIYYKEDNMIYKIEIEVSKKETSIIDKLSNIDVYSSIFTYNKKKYIEISSSNTINSISNLSNKLNISLDNITTVIGNLSEKEIISEVEETYVVSNSPKELKDLSKHKTKSNNCKGVEQIIKKIIKNINK